MAKRSALVVVALLVAIAAHAESRRRGVAAGPRWNVPRCAAVQGFPSVSVSVDGGRSVLAQEESPAGVQIYTFGLAALPRPDALAAITGRLLLLTKDAGCTWDVDTRFAFPEHLYRFADPLWAWSPLSPQLFHFDADGAMVAARTAPVLRPVTLHADAFAPQRMATADDQGNLWWSDDGALTWTLHAVTPSRTPLYSIEFAPRSREHVVTGGLADGAFVSFDGGTTWTRATGLDSLNVFRIAFSPLDANVVWAITLDPRVIGVARRAIHRSDDGGRSWRRVISASEELKMTNGFTIEPSPRDASLLYVALPGTSLFLIDGEGRQRWAAQLPHRDVNAIVFSPASPDVLYFGLKVSDMTLD